MDPSEPSNQKPLLENHQDAFDECIKISDKHEHQFDYRDWKPKEPTIFELVQSFLLWPVYKVGAFLQGW
jgi:hypothetical protein